MLATGTVVAHAGEEALYVLVPLLVLYVGWRVWDRRWGEASSGADEDDTPEQRSPPSEGSHGR